MPMGRSDPNFRGRITSIRIRGSASLFRQHETKKSSKGSKKVRVGDLMEKLLLRKEGGGGRGPTLSKKKKKNVLSPLYPFRLTKKNEKGNLMPTLQHEENGKRSKGRYRSEGLKAWEEKCASNEEEGTGVLCLVTCRRRKRGGATSHDGQRTRKEGVHMKQQKFCGDKKIK